MSGLFSSNYISYFALSHSDANFGGKTRYFAISAALAVIHSWYLGGEDISETFLLHNSDSWGWVSISIFSRALTSISSRDIPLIERALPFIQRSLPVVQRLEPLQQRSLPLCELSWLPQLENALYLPVQDSILPSYFPSPLLWKLSSVCPWLAHFYWKFDF